MRVDQKAYSTVGQKVVMRFRRARACGEKEAPATFCSYSGPANRRDTRQTRVISTGVRRLRAAVRSGRRRGAPRSTQWIASGGLNERRGRRRGRRRRYAGCSSARTTTTARTGGGVGQLPAVRFAGGNNDCVTGFPARTAGAARNGGSSPRVQRLNEATCPEGMFWLLFSSAFFTNLATECN